MKEFQVIVNTPQKQLYQGMATAVNVPGAEGGMTILADHAPLLSKLSAGTIKIDTPTGSKEFQITEGFIEVNENQTTLLIK